MNIRSLLPFLAITFGLTWGLAALLVLFPEPLEAVFGELSMTNPLFILAVYAPAFAAFILVARQGGIATIPLTTVPLAVPAELVRISRGGNSISDVLRRGHEGHAWG